MSPTWDTEEPGEVFHPRWWQWPIIAVRGFCLVVLILIGLILLGGIRLIEAPVFGLRRPVTPFITVAVCRSAFAILGLRRHREGTPMQQPGAVVANHASWLDIFSLNACKRVYFVSKAEVAGWPGIGLLARAVGTVFITRDRRHAKAHKAIFEERLLAGHKLLFFPEGTSTDGLRVLPFKTTLFEAFLTPDLRDHLYVQPVSVIYTAPPGAIAQYYGWWGDMDLAPHLLQVLGTLRQGHVTVRYHPPVKVADFPNRKALAKAVEEAVRAGMPADRQSAG